MLESGLSGGKGCYLAGAAPQGRIVMRSVSSGLYGEFAVR
jgi:hypothetical protein